MTKEIISPIIKDNWILVDVHSGHTLNNSDDGVSDPETMVIAALRKGVLPGFTGHNTLEGWQQYLKTLKSFHLDHLAIPSVEWGFTHKDPNGSTKAIGEVLTVIPPDTQLLKKMDALSQRWHEYNYHNELPLAELWNYLTQNLTLGELRSLLVYYPHPITIDQSVIGKILLSAKDGLGTRFISPHLLPQNHLLRIDAIEVLNAGHPGFANHLSYEVAQSLYPHAAVMASSDAHDPGWYGTAATLVKTRSMTTEGIFCGIKEHHTIPISGLGKIKETWAPLFLWTISSRRYTPSFVRSAISQLSNIQKAAHHAVEKSSR